ncbi:MAG: hypothetical protein K2M97_04485, partial [Muribaculaceae bacterium]|nr:hypothetical protein [Muribaculaceae bacterium]
MPFEVYDIEEGTPVVLSVTPNIAENKRVIFDAFTVILSPSSAHIDYRPDGIAWIDETGFASIPNLYSAEAIEAVKAAINELPQTATRDEVMTVARTIYAAALNKHLRFINVAADDRSLPHHHLAVSADATSIISSESESDLNSLWSLRAGETDGTYRLFCYGTQDYCGAETRTISVTAENGSYSSYNNSSDWADKWISSAAESAPVLTIASTNSDGTANNFARAITSGDLKYFVGSLNNESTLTLTCTEGWAITAMQFTAVQDDVSVNITVGSDTYATSTEGVEISAQYIGGTEDPVTIQFNGSNKGTFLRDFTVTLTKIEVQPGIASDLQIVIPDDCEFENLIAIRSIANRDYIHYDIDGDAITTGDLSDTGSQWLVGLADDLFAEHLTGSLDPETDVYTIAAVTKVTKNEAIRRNASCHESLVMTITDKVGKSMTYELTEVEETGVVTIDCSEFPAGDYTITIPLGYFEQAEDGTFDTPDGYTFDYQETFTITDNRAEAIDLLAGMANAPALWNADDVDKVSESLMALGKKTATEEEMAALIDPLYNSIIGKHVYFTNRHESNNGHRLAADTENQELTSVEAPDHNVKAIWEIVGTDTPGEYRLFNVHDELFADFSPESTHPNIPMSAEGVAYRISYPARHWADHPVLENEVTLEALGNCSEADGHADHHFLHDGTSNLNVTAFNNYHPASHWIVSEAAAPEAITVTYDYYGNITFANPDGKEVTRNSEY